MPRFVLELGEIQMFRESQKQRDAAIQKTALPFLSDIRAERPCATRFPREWLGIILRPDIDVLNKDLERVGDIVNRWD